MKKILKLDSQFSVIDGQGIEILDTLPPGCYELKFAQMRGFWLESIELEAFQGKVYGEQRRLSEKVIRRYAATQGRNLGVLLSGEKGTGKSLFVRNLAAGLSKDLPVVVIKANMGKGMLSLLSNIRGKCVIIFDEFEKMFRAKGEVADKDNDVREQEEALSFFDGVEARQEKLILMTVNHTWDLSTYLLGRPGRIYYHFRMRLPNKDEIKEYLIDNLKDTSGLEDIADRMVSKAVSWDCLSAMVAELNAGEPLDETLKDLNISSDTGCEIRLSIKAVYEDGYETVNGHDCTAYDTMVSTTFRRPLNPSKHGADCGWTGIQFPISAIKPTGMPGEFTAEFTQASCEDRDDKPLPNAPKIKEILIYRQSYLQMSRSCERNLSMLV